MKKFLVFILAIGLGLSAVQAFASSKGINTISGVCQAYFGSTPSVQDLGNNNYSISGPGGNQTVKFTDATINRMALALNNSSSSQSLETMCPQQANALRLAMTSKVVYTVPTLSQPCSSEKCKEQEGAWKGIPPAGTITQTIKNGTYGHFQVVYDSSKKCPAVQQWRKNPSDSGSERMKLWFRDKAMANQWLARGMTGEQLEAKLAGATFRPASVGYQKWIDLGL